MFFIFIFPGEKGVEFKTSCFRKSVQFILHVLFFFFFAKHEDIMAPIATLGIVVVPYA